jgi:hypothetical protein
LLWAHHLLLHGYNNHHDKYPINLLLLLFAEKKGESKLTLEFIEKNNNNALELYKEIIKLHSTLKDWFNDRYTILLLWITSNTLLGEIDDEFTIYGKVFGEGVEPNLIPYNRKIGSLYKTELGFRLGGLASEQDEFIKTKVRYLMEKQNLKAFINTNNSEVYFINPENEAKFHRTHFDRMWEFK